MRGLFPAAVGGAIVLLVSCGALAAAPFVDAPLTLPPLHFSADVGVGFGTFQNYGPDPSNPDNPPLLLGGTQVGWGTNLEAAVGLPYVGELGLRIGYRFGPAVSSNDGTTVPARPLGHAHHSPPHLYPPCT